MTVRRILALALLGVLVALGGAFLYSWLTFPSDRTPEGAYYRVVKAVNNGKPQEFFAYLEEPAQHACFSIADYRRQSRELIVKWFQEPEKSRLAAQYAAEAAATDGAALFSVFVEKRRWLDRLRRDLSGIESVTTQGERATVITARGTRYSFRRRPNGIWGLTLFTAELVAEAEKAARDHGLVKESASDYRRAAAR